MNDEMKYKVCINCHTYNHSNYICDALNGFTMQETNFPFIIMLVDDNSTDGEQKVISDYVSDNFEINFELSRETDYATIHFGQHKINRNCYIVIHYLKYNHYQKRKAKDPYLSEWRNNSDYEALCEGDDYWTDPYKLQKQVDLLEANPDCSFCCGGYIQRQVGVDDILRIEKRGDMPFFKLDFRDWLDRWFTMPLTTMYRKKEYFSEIEKYQAKYKYFRDVHMYYHLLQIGKGIYISENLAVHIYHPGGIASMQPVYIKVRDHNNVYREIYDVTSDIRMRVISFNSTINRLKFRGDLIGKIRLFKYAWSISISFKEKYRIFEACLIYVLKKYILPKKCY